MAKLHPDKSIMMDHLKDYCYYFLHRLESKFASYLRLLDEDSTDANKTTLVGRGLSAGVEAIPTVGPFLKYVVQESNMYLSNRRDRATAKRLRMLVYKHFKNQEASQKLYLSVAYELFACYEKQFLQVTCKDDLRSIMNLAYDAVETFKSTVSKTTPMDRGTFDQKWIIEGIVRTQKSIFKNPMKPSRTVKTQPKIGSKESKVKTWKCRDIYTKVSVYYSANNTFYVNKNKQFKSDKYGFRLAFTFETPEILGKAYNKLNDGDHKDIHYTLSPKEFELYYLEIQQYYLKRQLNVVKVTVTSLLDTLIPSLMLERNEELLKHGPSVAAKEGVIAEEIETKVTPLIIAANNGDIEKVERLLKQGVDVHEVDDNGLTSLHWTALNGHLEVVQKLLSQGAKVNAVDNEGFTSLHNAALNGHLEVVDVLLSHGADANAVDNNGSTSLNCAALNGHVEVVEKLLLHDADINAVDNGGFSSSLCAVQNGHLEVLGKLLTHGAEVDSTATTSNHNQGSTPLICAAEYGYLEIVEELLRYGAKVSAVDAEGSTSLHYAALHGHLEVVEKLLMYNVDVDAGDNEGFTSLHTAALNGHLEVVERLLNHGADYNALSNKGFTSLICAVEYGHVEVVETLLQKGVDVNAVSNSGSTSLHYAALNGHLEVLEKLLRYQVDVNAVDEEGFTSLHTAAQNGQLEVVEKLIEQGVDVNAVSNKGSTSLHYAAFNGHLEVVEALLMHGSNVHAVDEGGFTSLCCAAQSGRLEVVEELLQHGAEVNALNNHGDTSLSGAAENGHLRVVEILLKHGADVNMVDNDGDTALICAAKNGHLEIINRLLSHGAVVNTVNNKGFTFFNYAAKDGNLEIVEEFLKHLDESNESGIILPDSDQLVWAVIDKNQCDGTISPAHWRLIEESLADSYLEVLQKSPGAAPRCHDAGWFDQVKLIACADQRSADLYKMAIDGLGELWPGARIEAVTRDLIPSRPRSRTWLPSKNLSPAKVLKIIQDCNPLLPTRDWKVAKIGKAESSGRQAIIILNKQSLPHLEKSKGVIKFGFGTITLHVYKMDKRTVIPEGEKQTSSSKREESPTLNIVTSDSNSDLNMDGSSSDQSEGCS